MASIFDAQFVLKQRLNDYCPTLNFSWPNVDFEAVHPYVDASIEFIGSDDRTLAASDTHDMGFVQLVVVVAQDTSSEDVSATVDMLRAALPMGLRLTRNQTTVLIKKPLSVMARGYNDGRSYRLPASVPFESYGP